MLNTMEGKETASESKQNIEITTREQSGLILSGPMYTVLRVSQFVGVAPVQFRKHNDGWQVTLSPALYVWQVIFGAVLISLTMTGAIIDHIQPQMKVTRFRNMTMEVVGTIDFVSSVLTSTIAVSGGLSRTKKILQSLNKIYKMKASIIGDATVLPKQKGTSLFILVFIFFHFAISFLDYYSFLSQTRKFTTKFNGTWFLPITMYYGFIILLFEMQFTFTALEIHAAMGLLNENLENISTDHLKQPFARKKSNQTHESIRDIASSFDDICFMIRQCNSTFGPALIFLLASLILRLIINPYNFIVRMSKYVNNTLTLLPGLMQLCYCVVNFFCMVLMMEPAHMTQLQMDRTGCIVSQMLIKTKNVVVSSDLDKFSRYLAFKKVVFAPMGICTLSRSFITKILGMIATYLVIVLQLQTRDYYG